MTTTPLGELVRLSNLLADERDRYWQALVDIVGLENWEERDARQIACEALGEDAEEVGR